MLTYKNRVHLKKDQIYVNSVKLKTYVPDRTAKLICGDQ